MVDVASPESRATVAAMAKTLVAARREGRALSAFPGEIPDDLQGSYACQEAAIALWPDEIAGWKVGGVAPTLWDRFGTTRVVGPIFRQAVRRSETGQVTAFPVFDGGFAAVEAEFTVSLRRDAEPDRLAWTIEQAFDLIGAVYISIETAGSPLATINALGPLVIASDFGNNAGLILGPELSGWQDRSFESVQCETTIDGQSVGRGNGLSLAGGPLESLRILLEINARRGRPLTAGTLVATGAVTGVHDIRAGQNSHVSFGKYGTIDCRAERYLGMKK